MPYNKNDPGYHQKIIINRQKHYKKHRSRIIEKIRLREKKNFSKVKEFVDSFLIQCKDCGNSDKRVLEFDHLRDKLFNVSYAARRHISLNKVKLEITKCEIVCGNCHRIRTHGRRELKKLLKKILNT